MAAILRDDGVDVDGGAIASVVLSHHHWDHVGDAGTFSRDTEVVVGPGFKRAHLPGWPENPQSTLLQKDFEGRTVREVDFEEAGEDDRRLKIGRFRAWDYFGDGSFYLLDTPGHSVGHICGLARTTAAGGGGGSGGEEEDSFVFMGGDAAHHGGEFRPTAYLPLPKTLDPSPLVFRGNTCPGHLLQDIHPHASATEPFYVLTENFPDDKKTADWTLDGLGEFDAQGNVFMVMAHDMSIVDPPRIDFYPKPLNDWRRKGLGVKTRWLFLADFEPAVDAKEAGKPPFTWAKQT